MPTRSNEQLCKLAQAGDTAARDILLGNWVCCFDNLKLSGVIFAGGVTNKNEIDGHPALLEAYEAGKKL